MTSSIVKKLSVIRNHFSKINTKHTFHTLQNTQWLDPEELKNLQKNKLCNILKHAFLYSPYYHKVFKNRSLKANDFENFDDFDSLPSLDRKTLKKNIDSIRIPNSNKSKLFWSSTGGSTGEPLSVPFDINSLAYRDAIQLRCWNWWGIEYGDKQIQIWGQSGSFNPSMAGKARYLISKVKGKLMSIKTFSAYETSSKNMDNWVNIFLNFKPTFMYTYTSSSYIFAQYILNNGYDLSHNNLKAVICTAEPLYEFQRQLIGIVFNAPVVNEYGSGECGICAFECPEGGFHIMVENVYVELIVDGRNAKPGEMGEIVVTTLNNYAAPLIRYRTGDMGVIRSQKCRCGRGLPLLEKVEGRAHDQIISNSGAVVHGEFFTHLMEYAPGVDKFKIIQQSKNHLNISIVTNDQWLPSAQGRIIHHIKRKMGEETKVTFNFVDRIDSDPSGKFRWIVSEIHTS